MTCLYIPYEENTKNLFNEFNNNLIPKEDGFVYTERVLSINYLKSKKKKKSKPKSVSVPFRK